MLNNWKNVLLVCSTLLSILPFSNTHAQPPIPLWAYGFQVDVKDIATDAIGNAYVLGSFSGTVDLDPGSGVDIESSASGWEDICVIKFNAIGEFQWGHKFGGVGFEYAVALDLDEDGNVYFGGNYNGIDIDFDPSGNTYLISGGGVIVTKLDSNGLFVWARQLTTDINPILRHFTVDSMGNTICSVDLGPLTGTLDVDPTIGEVLIPNPGGYSTLLWRLDVYGDYVWHKTIEGFTGGYIAVSFDESGSVYIAGDFNDSINVGTIAAPEILNPSGDRDIMLCKYAVDGTLFWAKTISGLSSTTWASVWSIDAKGGQVLIGGQFTESFDFDPELPTTLLTALGVNNLDGFMALYDADNGQFVRALKLGDIVGYDAVQKVRLDGTGNVYAIGVHRGSVDFDPGPNTQVIDAGLNELNYVVKWGPAGEYDWVFGHYTQNLNHYVLTLGVGDELYLGGSYSGAPVDIDPSSSSFLLSGSLGWFGKFGPSISTGIELNQELGNSSSVLKLIDHSHGQFELTLPPDYSGGEFNVFDLAGKCVKTQQIGKYAQSALFDMVAHSYGVYLFRWSGESGDQLSIKAVYY